MNAPRLTASEVNRLVKRMRQLAAMGDRLADNAPLFRDFAEQCRLGVAHIRKADPEAVAMVEKMVAELEELFR